MNRRTAKLIRKVTNAIVARERTKAGARYRRRGVVEREVKTWWYTTPRRNRAFLRMAWTRLLSSDAGAFVFHGASVTAEERDVR